MVMDKELLLCESLSIAASAAGSTDSTNIVYFPQFTNFKGTATDDRPNVGTGMCLNIVVEDEDMLAAVDGSVVTFALYADTDATTVTTDGTVILTKDITENTPSEHPDGTQICCIPLPVEAFDQYLQLKVSVATQDLSTGKITAWIGPPTQQG